MCRPGLLLPLVLVLAAPIAHADVKLPSLISDNMVLQRDMPAPIWGAAVPGEQIKVTLGTRTADAVAGSDGSWKVSLPPMHAGGPYDMTVAGKNTITVKNILIGEVWLCSGQSNMVMMVSQCNNAPQEIADAKNYPMIRHYNVERVASPEPLKDTVGTWEIADPKTAGHFTATGYFFARDICETLKVPVGIIMSGWGGTNMEAWCRTEVLQQYPESKPYFEKWKQFQAGFPKKVEAYPQQLADWKQAADEAKKAGKPVPKMPKEPKLEASQNRPGSLYNGMIAPLIPYAIRGNLWAGGKANWPRGIEYRVLMPAMIKDWRKQWGEGTFPFYICQMANWISTNPLEEWQWLRESMLKTTDLRGTGMVVVIDIGEAHNVHPKNKQEVSRRLALIAKSQVYGMNAVYSGPVYDSMTIEGNAIRLKFKHVESGLAARGGGSLKGFAIAGSDRKFVTAGAAIDGDTIVVRDRNVVNPVAVRYAWEMNPDCNLINKSGLPASPFRTDDWPWKKPTGAEEPNE